MMIARTANKAILLSFQLIQNQTYANKIITAPQNAIWVNIISHMSKLYAQAIAPQTEMKGLGANTFVRLSLKIAGTIARINGNTTKNTNAEK